VSTAEKIQTAGVLVAALAIAARFVETARVERRRTQPVVIAHERRGRMHDERRGWAAVVVLRNDGLGPAFNVRFGVEYDGVRIPHKLRAEDPDRGNRQRVLGAGERLPEKPSVIPIRMSSDVIWGVAAKRVGKDRDGKRDRANLGDAEPGKSIRRPEDQAGVLPPLPRAIRGVSLPASNQECKEARG
jgi:hypothetical protein